MNENKSYDDGICDTWDCIRDIARMGKDKRQKLFRETNIVKIVKEYNPWEVFNYPSDKANGIASSNATK